MIIARYDAILDQSKRVHLYNHLSNYTKVRYQSRPPIFKNVINLIKFRSLMFFIHLNSPSRDDDDDAVYGRHIARKSLDTVNFNYFRCAGSLRGQRTKGREGKLNSSARCEESAKHDRWDLRSTSRSNLTSPSLPPLCTPATQASARVGVIAKRSPRHFVFTT